MAEPRAPRSSRSNSPASSGAGGSGRQRNGGSGGALAAEATASTMRGALLVLAAVVLGVVLLQVVDNGDSGGNGTTNTTAADRTTSTSRDDTTTTRGGGALKSPAELRIQVLNGAGVQGAAGNMTEALKALGYTNAADPGDTDRREGNAVLCKAGLEGEVARLATEVGDAEVVEFPATPPNGVTDETVECVVIVGAPAAA